MILKYFLLGFLFLSTAAIAQEAPPPLTSNERKEVIDSISTILEREYVFPEIGKEISAHLQQKHKDGAYNSITDPIEFSQVLSEDVRAINNDLHLRVRFSPEMIAEWQNTISPEDSLAMEARQRRSGQLNNYGFQEVKLLDGNIGYLNLTGFYNVTEEAGQTAQAAMNFLSNADALIIDLRSNGGGSPSMIQLITSYLYGPEPVHLNTFYYRPQEDLSQTWTLPYVPGKRRPDIDVYVLTSSGTFSAAEEFSYNLRNLERATLIGEVTGGGAHPGGTRIATDRFTVWVPSGRAINPITKTNWEGTGVQPHIEVPADQALNVAQIKAIEKLLEKSDDDSKFLYEWALIGLQAAQNPVTVDKALLESYAGKYGPRTLSYENGKLYYQREGRNKYELTALDTDLFMAEGISGFRIKINVENGEITGLTGLYNNGHSDQNKRDQTAKIKP
ncbi:MAG: hypothetical protein KDC34_17230 [Saprospiraceae bacterium]|nr:hypothetical protein [Saprospiraceae bacterium]